jgi:thiosulfate dehydrogenase [quinone] large subunit
VGSSMDNVYGLIGNPADVKTPRALSWLQRSKSAALVWNAMRIWLGVMWLQAGIAKIWGKENPAFLHNGGAGVAGFAAHGVAAYSWWATFLHSFVVPNAGWIGVLVAFTEFGVGVCLVLGFLTPLACLASLLLLFTYVMSGTASVCALYALFAIVILAMWRTSSWIGVGGFMSGFRQRRAKLKLASQEEPVIVVVAPVAPEPEPVNAWARGDDDVEPVGVGHASAPTTMI